MARQLTEAARAAKQIRAMLKREGIKARVTSSNFSMGDAVDIDLDDAMHGVVKHVERLVAPFQYGHFDGMQDLYEMTNKRDDIPQAKYVMVQNHVSDETWASVERYCAGYVRDWSGLGEYERMKWKRRVWAGECGSWATDHKPRIRAA